MTLGRCDVRERRDCVALFILLLGACSANAPPAHEPLATPSALVCPRDSRAASSSPLRASVHVIQPRVSRIQDLAVDVNLANGGAAPVRWLSSYAEAGSLALEVRDASCKPVSAGPPPTPSVDDGVTHWNTLSAGGSVSLSYRRWVMSDVPTGHFEVRFGGIPGDEANADVRSAWMQFEVAAPEARDSPK
jgi:hypothetical protein